MSFPLFAKLNVTSRCNLRCRHCFIRDHQGDMPYGFITELAQLFESRKVAAVALIGGEPLLRDDLEEIALQFSSRGMNVNLATNGILLDEERIDTLTASGVRQIQVSLDGSCDSVHDAIRGIGTFDRARSSVRRLVARGVPTAIAWTVHAENYMDFRSMAAMASDLCVNRLRVQYYLPDCDARQDKLALRPAMIHGILEAAESIECGSMTLELPFARGGSSCGAGVVSCVVNSNMTISPCDLLAEREQSQPARDCADFARLWLRDPVFERWRNGGLNAVACKTCEDRARCSSHCLAGADAYRDTQVVPETMCIARGLPTCM